MLTSRRVCSRCGHEFRRRIGGVYLLVMRLERCPSCGAFNTYSVLGESTTVGDKNDHCEPLDEHGEIQRRIEESR